MVGGRIVSNVMSAMTIRILKTISQLGGLQVSESTLTRMADQMTVAHRRTGRGRRPRRNPRPQGCVIGEGTAEVLRTASRAHSALATTTAASPPCPGRLIRETVHARTDLEVYTPFEDGFAQGHGNRQGLRTTDPRALHDPAMNGARSCWARRFASDGMGKTDRSKKRAANVSGGSPLPRKKPKRPGAQEKAATLRLLTRRGILLLF